jgi:putative DNA primase/helicase
MPHSRESHLQAILDTAMRYAAHGIAVVPIVPHDAEHPAAGKAPALKNWQNTRLEIAEVKRLFEHPKNIGIVTGKASGIIVVDIDPRNGGNAWLSENEHRLGKFIHETTGSGGVHLYYKYPSGHDGSIPSFTGKNALAPGVDFLADGGHQVVTTPSIHATGNSYEITNGLDLTQVTDEADEPPAWLMAQVFERAAVKSAAPINIGTGGYISDPEELKIAVDKLWAAGPAVKGDGANDTALAAALIGHKHAVPKETWWAEINKWNAKNPDPLTPKELQVRMDWAYSREGAGCLVSFAAFLEAPDTSAMPEPTDTKGDDSDEDDENDEDNAGSKKQKFKHKNPVQVARAFEQSVDGLVCLEDAAYVYENNEWRFLKDPFLSGRVHRTIMAKAPNANLKSNHTSDAVRTIKHAYVREGLAFDTWFDGRPGDFVRLQNGILDLNKIKLLPLSKEWFSETTLPFAYDPDARCPRFDEFLNSLWGNGPLKDHIPALQRWLGYSLSSDTSQQSLALFLGFSRAGKGTLLRLMINLIGRNNVASTSVNDIASQFGLEDLVGKKLLLFPDARRGTSSATNTAAERIMCITGEDTVRIDRKNKLALNVRLPCKIVLAANTMPPLADANGALGKRLILFRFIKSFSGKEDRTLDSALFAELPGIFNWAIDGLREYKRDGVLLRPDSSRKALEEIGDAMSPTEAFVREYVVYAPGEMLRVDELYTLYRAVSKECNNGPVSKFKLLALISEQFASYSDVKKTRQRVTYSRDGGVTVETIDEDSPLPAHSDPKAESMVKTVFSNLRLVCTPERYCDSVNKSLEGLSSPEETSDDDDGYFI